MNMWSHDVFVLKGFYFVDCEFFHDSRDNVNTVISVLEVRSCFLWLSTPEPEEP